MAEDIRIADVERDAPGRVLASWGRRAAALSVDVFPGLGASACLAAAGWTLPVRTVWWWACMSTLGAVILAVLVNRLLLPAITGWSLGRALFGIVVVRRDSAPAGAWRLLLRDLAHLLDTGAVFVGWLFPLWDAENRTFADLLLRTEVRAVDSPGQSEKVRRWTAIMLAVATAICIGAASVSYAVVYATAQETDRARAELSDHGPKIVAQMLTYDPRTLHEDFTRALSLTTGTYRPQLAAQQQIVEKGQPVVNEYWGSSNSILAATPDRVTMLLFLQGRRGDGQQMRYITASVRVRFLDVDGRWLVDDLAVLTKPKPAGGGR
ncbi:RDD family protein [Mycobacterium sp.]|uniref:RDD family protein n=1 Tax=Mycobacterium sp. TaxID=1785 RepID=UPI003A877578